MSWYEGMYGEHTVTTGEVGGVVTTKVRVMLLGVDMETTEDSNGAITRKVTNIFICMKKNGTVIKVPTDEILFSSESFPGWPGSTI